MLQFQRDSAGDFGESVIPGVELRHLGVQLWEHPRCYSLLESGSKGVKSSICAHLSCEQQQKDFYQLEFVQWPDPVTHLKDAAWLLDKKMI